MVLVLVAAQGICLSQQAPEIVRETVMVPMRDGTKLATDLWWFKDARAPAILMRSPYGKAPFAPVAERGIGLGFAAVTQSTRGMQGSEGASLLFLDDG